MFVEKTAGKKSLDRRSPIFGVGINDSDYVTGPIINGKRNYCPFFSVWKTMLLRCYYDPYKKRNPTYHGCEVFSGWLTFSVFRAWMETQDWKGKHLDKDIILPGNKTYHPDFCVFVDGALNVLLAAKPNSTGFPHGVSVNPGCRTFRASICKNYEITRLGYYETISEAADAYAKAKSDHVLGVASTQTDERIKSGLIAHARLILENK